MLNSSWTSQTGSSVLSISSSRDGLQIAVGTADSCLVLDASGSGKVVFDSGPGQGPVTCIAITAQGNVLAGSNGLLRLWDAREHQAEPLRRQDLRSATEEETGPSGSVVLARLGEHDTFAAASQFGRQVLVVTGELQVTWRLDLHQSSGCVRQLSWLSETAVIATTDGGLQAWAKLTEDEQSTTIGDHSGLILAEYSPDRAVLATSPRDGVVCLWNLVNSGSDTGGAEVSKELLSTLKSSTGKVRLLHWQPKGKYLVTADGGEAIVWDVTCLPEEPVASTVCGGHEPKTRITCVAFQSDGPILATGGSDGKLLFFNSDSFRPGETISPSAVAQYLPAGDEVAAMAWLPGGILVAGTSQGKVLGWQLEQPKSGMVSDSCLPGVPAFQTHTDLGDSATAVPGEGTGTRNGVDLRMAAVRGTDAGSKPKAVIETQRPSSVAERQGHPAQGRSSRSSGLASRPGGRESSGAAAPLERNASVPTHTSSREGLESFRSHLGRPESGVSISDSSRSASLQDNQSLGRRSGSLERAQLSPGLMQRIQQVQQRPTAQNRQREPAGWGMGSPSAASSPQMQYATPGMMPFNMAPGQMPPGYMMVPNPAMMPGHMMPGFGFPPGMPPMPMMPHGPVGQAGMVGAKGSMPQGLPPGMVYMPMAGMPHQQWSMMQAPWMGYQFLPGAHPSPEQVRIISAGRSSSAPNGPLTFNRAARPAQSSEAREGLTKNAISLPSTVGRDALRAGFERSAAAKGDVGSGGEGEKLPTGAAKRQGLENPELVGVKDDSQEGGPWTPPSDGLRAPRQFLEATDNGVDEAPQIGERPSAVMTVYVGNLAQTVDESALHGAFAWCGAITNIQVIRDKHSMQSRGFAFVSYAHPVFAASAITHMNGRMIYGDIFRGRAMKVGPTNRLA